MSKFTAGPFHAKINYWNEVFEIVDEDNTCLIAMIPYPNWEGAGDLLKIAKANVRLLTAAPEMYAALQKVSEILGDDDEIHTLLAQIDGKEDQDGKKS